MTLSATVQCIVQIHAEGGEIPRKASSFPSFSTSSASSGCMLVSCIHTLDLLSQVLPCPLAVFFLSVERRSRWVLFYFSSVFLHLLEPAPSGLQPPWMSSSCLPRCCECAGEYKGISKLGDSCSPWSAEGWWKVSCQCQALAQLA